MNDFNIDENTINKLKDMLDKGDISKVASQIPPDVLQNFSSALQNGNSNSSSQNTIPNSNSTDNGKSSNSNASSNFDFSNVDMNSILKMKSIIDKMNTTNNDPRSNLLHSLKPYLRNEKKEKLDQYANLLNFAKVAEMFKNDNKGNHP